MPIALNLHDEPKIRTELIRFPTDADLDRAADILRKGGLVAFPTETVYGLGALGTDAVAAEKIYRAKGRPSDNPLILHLARADQADLYGECSLCFEKLAALFMPGPLTVILKKRSIVPSTVTGGLDTVAIRVPAHPIAHELLKKVDLPIAAPSANLSGRPSCTTFAHVVEDMNGRVDMILDGGDCELGVESTILLPVGNGAVKLLRPGAVTVEMLENAGFVVSLDKAVTEKLKENECPLAPGMKYRHYAPKAQVILLDGSREQALAYMQKEAHDASSAFLAPEELISRLNASARYSLGKETDKEEQAHRLFSVLRALDDSPNIQKAFAWLPSHAGIGLALYNRLLKAAGYTVLSAANESESK